MFIFVGQMFKYPFMKKILKLQAWIFLMAAMLSACSLEFDATPSEMDLAITRVDDNQDFSAYHTFFLPDTVIYVGVDDENSDDLDRTHNAQIISEVRQHFSDMGWIEITDTARLKTDADVVVLISALAVDANYYYANWWNYWNWWYKEWWFRGSPAYTWYPEYPGYGYQSYDYSSGTVMIDMADLKDIQLPFNEGEQPKIDIIWTGAINGILKGTDYYISTRITKQLNQVFSQSPYLSKISSNG